MTKLFSIIIAGLFYTNGIAQIKNSKTETVKVYGNCGMCKVTIEKAGNVKKTAKVVWDTKTKMATLTYDTKKISQDEILKRIALSGYDSDKYLAPDDVYAKLHGCCQYERVKKGASKNEPVKENNKSTTTSQTNPATSQLKLVFDNYFLLKDELVNTDGSAASSKAKDVLTSVNAVKMELLRTDEHNTLMKVLGGLKENFNRIIETKDVEKQRTAFAALSQGMYELLKASKYPEPVYYQHCPMYNDGKGADWLSKENTIKNPYYGSQMMSCGKTVETIK